MDVNTGLAMWSNQLIVSAMVVYAIVMIAYAFDLFGRREQEKKQSAQVSSRRTKRVAQTHEDRVGAGSEVAAVSEVAASGGAGVVAATGSTATAVLDKPRKGQGGSGPVEGSAGKGTSMTPLGKKPRRRAARIGTALLVIAALLHVAAVLTRALSVMRVPWGNMMEYILTATAITVVVYLVALFKRDVRYLGTFVSGGVLLCLGLAITVFYTPAAQLIPALNSYWIAIHVPIAILSTSLLYISAILAVFQILKNVYETKQAGWTRFTRRLPGSSDIERVSYMLAAVGFITWTFTLIAGAIWAEVAWSRYWGWDSKEIWTFVVWVIYAAYLHARATRGWSQTKVAVLNLVGICAVIFNFAVVNVFLNGLHSYSGL